MLIILVCSHELFPLLVPSGPGKRSATQEDVPLQLLDEELESEGMLAHRLSSSPPRGLSLTHRLTPLRKARGAHAAQDAFPLKPSSVVLNKMPLSEVESPPSSARDDYSRSVSNYWMDCDETWFRHSWMNSSNECSILPKLKGQFRF